MFQESDEVLWYGSSGRKLLENVEIGDWKRDYEEQFTQEIWTGGAFFGRSDKDRDVSKAARYCISRFCFLVFQVLFSAVGYPRIIVVIYRYYFCW
jgi:hypothetical protein